MISGHQIALIFGILNLLSSLSVMAKSTKETSFFEDNVLPLMEEYCYDCHGDGAQKGSFSMEELLSMGNFGDHSKQWDRVWKNIYNRNMPPANVAQPGDEEISTILSWVEKSAFKHNPEQIDPGHIVLRRLNRIEYENTIKDLFHVTIDAENYFPADDTGYGFDTIGEVLTLSPLLMEKYLGMAEIVMEKTLGPINDHGEIVRLNANEIQGGQKYGDFRVLPSRGSFTFSHRSDLGGIYRVKVWASASRAGKELAKMQVIVNGKEIKTFSIDSEYPQKSIYSFQFAAKAKSSNVVSLSFLNDFYDPKNKNKKLRDRNLYVEEIELFLTESVASTFKESRIRLLEEWETKKIGDIHVINSLEKWIPRIYRMPLSSKESSRHIAFYEKMKHKGLTPLEALRQTFKASLISPRFIFREEKKRKEKNGSHYKQIDEFALAHRMSFFLWSSIPDDTLWRLAESGKLRANLHREFKRMLADSKIKEFVNNFCGQWLQLRDLNLVNPNPEQFPKFTVQVRHSMIQETQEFFKYLLTQNLPVDLLLGANFSMINRDLAQFYGLSGEFDQQFRKVIFKSNELQERGGLLTHGSILTITSNPTRTSPVKRGKWVLDNLLAAPPRDPPPGAAELEENHNAAKNLTFREQMTLHSKNPACYSCHASMDNLGYALDNFDAVGKWRSVVDGVPVDVFGKLSSGEEFNGVDELQNFLLQNKKQSIIRCLTQKLFTYGLGRGLTYKDRVSVDEVLTHFQKDQINLADLLYKVIESKPFQFSK